MLMHQKAFKASQKCRNKNENLGLRWQPKQSGVAQEDVTKPARAPQSELTIWEDIKAEVSLVWRVYILVLKSWIDRFQEGSALVHR